MLLSTLLLWISVCSSYTTLSNDIERSCSFSLSLAISTSLSSNIWRNIMIWPSLPDGVGAPLAIMLTPGVRAPDRVHPLASDAFILSIADCGLRALDELGRGEGAAESGPSVAKMLLRIDISSSLGAICTFEFLLASVSPSPEMRRTRCAMRGGDFLGEAFSPAPGSLPAAPLIRVGEAPGKRSRGTNGVENSKAG